MEYFNVSIYGVLTHKPNVLIPEDCEILQLNNNGISDISQVKFPPKLKKLFLGGNFLSEQDFSQIEFPEELEVLFLNDNSLTDISHIKFPPKLRYLNLSSNKIENISHIKFPNSIEKLLLALNRITDLTKTKYPNKIKILIYYGKQYEDILEFCQKNILYLFCGTNKYVHVHNTFLEIIKIKQNIKIIQRHVRKWYQRRKRKNNKIQNILFEIGYDMEYKHCYMAKKCMNNFTSKTLQYHQEPY